MLKTGLNFVGNLYYFYWTVKNITVGDVKQNYLIEMGEHCISRRLYCVEYHNTVFGSSSW